MRVNCSGNLDGVPKDMSTGMRLGIAGMGTGVCMLHLLWALEWELEWEDVFSRREREREWEEKM